ncbi:copper resistance CopC family protein [Dactylosporangium sp. CA-139066]|uniref:copper resistance CopC family protein n=1 Tax=Dactylosporangium sp. CA-139066 TaxID=3239930 RepID=UPI003D90CC2B
MRLSATIRALLAAAVLIPLLPATPAWAHATLLRTDPADGATVTVAVAAVTLTFNENVKQQFSTIVVTGADGQSYVDGAPRVVDRTLVQAVKPLPAGAVRVAWRTVSADGHPIEGQFGFTNAASGAPVAPSRPPVTATAGPAAGDGESAGWLWSVAGGVVLVVVAAGAVWWRRSSAGRSG